MTKLADSKAIWWFLALLTLFVYFYGLDIPLIGPDEPRYAQVAREMYERGDWITPALGGFDWFEKPSLLYWLQIAGYKLFGVNEFAARFGSALFGLGTVASLWLLGRYSNLVEQASEAIEFANWLALVGATTLGSLVFSRGASFDIIVTFPLTASLAGFFISDRAGANEFKKRNLGLFSFYFFAGLAILAKGLIGIVFPFATVALYFLLSRRLPSKQFLVSLVWGLCLLVAVAAIWNLPMYLRHGWKFIDEFYIQHHFQRFTSNKYQHPQPFYFYFWVLPLMTLPWLPWFVGGSFGALRNFSWVNKPSADGRNSTLRLFALAWVAVPLVFFSVSGSKLPGYILPAVPGAIILTGVYVVDFVKRSRLRRTAIFATATAMLAAVAICLTFVVPKFADRDSVKRLIQAGDTAGFSSSKVVNFRTLSHNAEFYAAGRLLRDEDGKQVRFDDPGRAASFISEERQPVLVLVPLKQLNLLQDRSDISIRVLAENTDLAIVAATRN